MNRDSKNCVLFFVKYPMAGRVKTRLAEQIGQDVATDLYRNFVTDILATLKSLDVNFKIVFAPADSKDQFQQWLGKEYSYVPQVGKDLGERMKNAFLYAFNDNFSRIVIIGSDSPDLSEDFLIQAFRALDTHDVVIGPASDGGYYLIGFTKEAFLPQVFEHITWSADTVFDQTLNILRQHRRNVYILPQWYDVDTLDDLKSLLSRNENTPFSQSRTFSCLTTGKLRSTLNV